MYIHNTLTGKKEVFKPQNPSKVTMYLCGPTVYDLGHIGHGRSATSFDIIRKYLLYKGFNVFFATNYTDIDDKMIKRARELNISVSELAEKIIPEYEKDYGELGISKADQHPKATDFIPQVIEIIKLLEEKGHTYVLDDGVYFDIKTFPAYGKLSKQKLDDLQTGARMEVKEDKRNPQDFVLWKFSKPNEPKWASPWGEGRPGWHIECSAMGRAVLGQPFDIHGGGLDLMFPHHECEIAQSECAYGADLCKIWAHNGFVTINQEKMSKSLGNFFTLRDILQQYPGQAIRFLFLQTHYRSPIEFNDDILKQAKNGLTRLHDFARRLENFRMEENKKDFFENHRLDSLLQETRKRFEEGMDNDFDTASGLAAWFDLLKEVNKMMDEEAFSLEHKEKVLKLMEDLDKVLGVLKPRITVEEIQPEILELIQKREEARKEKNWALADELRKNLLEKGIQIEDTAKGTVWKKV